MFLTKLIFLHDCLPKSYFHQATPRSRNTWNGDVWKAIVEARTMKDIDTYTCKADHGLGIIFKRPNRNLLSLKIDNFKKLKFKDYYTNHKNFMNIIEANDIDQLI